MKAIFLILAMLCSNVAVASLKSKLHKEVKQDHIRPLVSYKKARQYLFGYLHYYNGIIVDVYCQEVFDKFDGVGKMKIPDSRKLNAEHTHPRSKFNPNFNFNVQLSDLHNLFPTKSQANFARSNYEFSYVSGPGLSYCPISKLGRKLFEVPDDHKGNVARAKFYMSIRYQVPIDEREERTLREWHIIDPVDDDEIRRNYRIKDIQGNSNPFILEPKLVDYIQNF